MDILSETTILIQINSCLWKANCEIVGWGRRWRGEGHGFQRFCFLFWPFLFRMFPCSTFHGPRMVKSYSSKSQHETTVKIYIRIFRSRKSRKLLTCVNNCSVFDPVRNVFVTKSYRSRSKARKRGGEVHSTPYIGKFIEPFIWHNRIFQ